jgi:DNA gyrase subunit B
MTKAHAEVIQITLDNGETLICTGDHQFMLRDGGYKPAATLTPSDSLMPLYRKLADDGDEMVWNPYSDSWLFTHPSSANLQLAVNEHQAKEAIANYNHRIVSIQSLQETIDVYDIEVPHTHNFALASGVFVHNSAKQGRDRQFQAILPLRGKVLNTERAQLDKIIAFEELKAQRVIDSLHLVDLQKSEKEARNLRFALENCQDIDSTNNEIINKFKRKERVHIANVNYWQDLFKKEKRSKIISVIIIPIAFIGGLITGTYVK